MEYCSTILALVPRNIFLQVQEAMQWTVQMFQKRLELNVTYSTEHPTSRQVHLSNLFAYDEHMSRLYSV